VQRNGGCLRRPDRAAVGEGGETDMSLWLETPLELAAFAAAMVAGWYVAS